MKTLLRYFLINLVSLWATSEIIRGLNYTGGAKTLIIAAATFTLINLILIPLLRILLLPLNLLTLGFFAWVTNVLALFALTKLVPEFYLMPYFFPGWQSNGFAIPEVSLSTIWVAILASFLIGIFTHLLHWLVN